MTQQDILAELARLGTFGQTLTLQPLQGGVLNHSYVLSGEAGRFFVKTFDSAHQSASERRLQFETQSALAELGLAPQPRYLSPCTRFQVDTWVEHRSLRDSELSPEAQTQHLAACLSRVHQANVPARELDLSRDWQHYLNMANITPDKALSQALKRAQAIWSASAAQPRVFCHNDLSLQHCALEPAALLFDWEYAAMGDRFFDLAACIEVNQMDAGQSLALQRHYADLNGFDLNEVTNLVRQQSALVHLTSRLWYLAAGKRAALSNQSAD